MSRNVTRYRNVTFTAEFYRASTIKRKTGLCTVDYYSSLLYLIDLKGYYLQ